MQGFFLDLDWSVVVLVLFIRQAKLDLKSLNFSMIVKGFYIL